MNRVSPHRRKTRRALSCAAALCGFVAVPQPFDEAEPELREALRVQRSTLGDEHPEIASTLSNLEQGRLEEAVAAHLYGLEHRIVDGTDTAAIMESHAYLGHALHRVGRDEEAVEHVRAAVEWVDALEQPSTVAPIAHLAWAEVMTALGRERARALEVARRAREEAEHPPLRAAVDAWLAEHGDDSAPTR